MPAMRQVQPALNFQPRGLTPKAQETAGADGLAAVPSTPGRSGSGPLAQYPLTSARSRGAMPQADTVARGTSPRASPPGTRRSLREDDVRDGRESARDGRLHGRTGGTHSAALLVPAAAAVAATASLVPAGQQPVSKGSSSTTGLHAPAESARTSSSLFAGSSLGHLISKVSSSMAEREQAMQKEMQEQRETEDLLSRSKDELQQLIAVVSQLHELQLSASEVLPDMMQMGPERPRIRGQPPFFWQPSAEYAEEFTVSGDCGEVVTKTRDFEDQGWVIPVGGSWRLSPGGLYRWTLRIERKCPSRPQLQLGIHGENHGQPWRLVTTSRCSWSRDDEPWRDRSGGDRLIDEGDYVHIEVDMRGSVSKFGTFALAVNDEAFEQFFDDIPLTAPSAGYPLMPVVSMGGDQSRVRLCPCY